MGKRRLYDEDVHEVFDSFGVGVAIYFEAIRYRQQLYDDEFFAFSSEDIKKRTDLTYRQQARVRRILQATGWIQTERGFRPTGGTITRFRISDMARDLIKVTPRRRNIQALKNSIFNRKAYA